MSLNPVILIPSRLSAQRFDRKPLAMIHGKPMILWGGEKAKKSNIGPVVVACCSNEIKSVVESAGGIAVLTDAHLSSGTDRIHDALMRYDPEKKYDTVINLQGDLPTIDPMDIKKSIVVLERNAKMDIATLACPLYLEEEKENPNIVKAIVGNISDNIGQAFYFTRRAVASGNNQFFHHVGLYAFRRPVLEDVVVRPLSALEQQESLEQLRALEAGYTFGIHLTQNTPFGVDHPSDIKKAEKALPFKNT